MATAHLSVKVGKAGKGVPHAEYISRVGKYEKKLDGNEQLEATESGNMPLWAQDNPLLFWRAADLYERKNGTVYREHEIALPRELSPEHRAELVRDWVEQELGDRHAYTWAIHNKTALDGGEQPHQSKTVTAYKPPEQVKIKQNENQQPTQTQKKGRGIKH